MYSYQKTNRYFAQIADGLEELGAQELSELGAENVKPIFRGIYFNTDKGGLYRINYHTRFITRILAPLKSFECDSSKSLYRHASSIHWADFFSVDYTFAVFASVSDSSIKHSHYAALRVKDAVVDYFRSRFHERPNIDTITPDVWINLHIQNDKAVISLDTSGGSLHRRGYRRASVEAPMQETLAAAIIHLSEWDGTRPLVDPMCGSGTLLAEALLRYCRIPPGYLRKRFGFQSLPDFDPQIWHSVKSEAKANIRRLPEGLIAGSDILSSAVAAARKNLLLLPYGDAVNLKTTDFKAIKSIENSIIVCNPPYGIRIGRKGAMGAFMKSFGDFLKQRCNGSAAYIYFGDRALIESIGLKSSWKKPLKNADLDGRLVKYELY